MITTTLAQYGFVPGSGDVRVMRCMLASLGLPMELVLYTLDLAHYWPEKTVRRIKQKSLYAGRDTDYSAAYPYLWVPTSGCQRPNGERGKIREIEFTVVSFERSKLIPGYFSKRNISSWFEVSKVRPGPVQRETLMRQFHDIEEARCIWSELGASILPRPMTEVEPQRHHFSRTVLTSSRELSPEHQPEQNEGMYAWILQGNKRKLGSAGNADESAYCYRIVWGCAANPCWEGNKDAGRGEGFIDGLQAGDWIVVWAMTKGQRCENHIQSIRATVRYTI